MARKDADLDEGIIDLTELIEPGTTGGKAAAAYAKAAAAPVAEDDFDSVLQEAGAAVPPPRVDANESLDMSDMGGIDNLLESLDIPAQPREGAQAAKTVGADELDSVLDDLLPPAAPAKNSAPAMPSPTVEAPSDGDFDLDSLLEGEDPVAVPAEPALEAEKKSDLDADLDDILASFDEPPGAPAPDKAVTAPRAAEADLAADLDDILGDMDLPEEPASAAATAAQAAAAGTAMPEEDMPPMAAEPAPERQAGLSPDVDGEQADDFLADLEAPPEAMPEPESVDRAMSTELDAKLADQAESTPHEAPASAAPASAHPVLPAERAAPASMAVQTWPADVIAGLCQGIATAQGAGDRETIQEFSRELGAQSAHVQDMGGQLAQLGKRLLACESKIAASRARIASLEKGMEAASALEDLLRAGSPLHAGFMSLISTAVGNALQNFTPPDNQGALEALEARFAGRVKDLEGKLAMLEGAVAAVAQDQVIQSRLDALEGRLGGAEDRLAALEKKMDDFVSNFDAGMEKAAATVVSRILQEEISRLLQE